MGMKHMVSSLYLIKTFKRQYGQLWCLNHNAIVSLLVDKSCDNKLVSVKCYDRTPIHVNEMYILEPIL